MFGKRGRDCGTSSGFVVESLETRIVLSSVHELASVTLASDESGFHASAAEFTWAADRTVTGTEFTAGPAGPESADVDQFSWINGPDGRIRTIDDTLTGGTSIGTRFIGDEGYPSGWNNWNTDDDSAGSFSAIIERPDSATTEDLAGSYVWNFTQITDGGVFTRTGFITINATSGLFSFAHGAVGDPQYLGESFELLTTGPNGRFEYGGPSGDSGVMYLSRDFNTLLIADLNEAGGDSWVGIAIRQNPDFSPSDLAGSYRFGAAAEGGTTSGLFGARTTAQLLEIDEDGTYTASRLDLADSGSPGDPISSGTYVIESGLVTLTDSETEFELWFTRSENGSTLLFQETRSPTFASLERTFGTAVLIPDDGDRSFDTSVSSAVFDAEGAPLAYALSEGEDAWSVVDLDRFGFGDPLGANPADIEAFTTTDDSLFAMVTTDDGLFAFERGEDGFWRGSNLSDRLAGATNITSSITVFNDLAGKSHVGGVNADGDVVTYVLDPAQTEDDGWSFLNITESQLEPQGRSTPVFVGPIISYVTSWNGLNIAGLDASGDIQAVWSGNGGTTWNSSNLSTITGAPSMASGLTAYLTSWGGINIVGLDDSGRVLATWWVPQFGGEWRIADLTAASGGPVLTGASLTSFVAPWGGLNVAGLSATGDVIAYWWSPATEQQGLGWEFANLTGGISESDPRPSEQLHSQTNTSFGGEMNVLGTDETTGDLLRLFFRVENGSWMVQNVASEAEYI